jgi:2-polyprenyl-3-methyl-5-hydroxy-6-metoxy-1,4-benzoquinol methylase
VKAYYEAYWNRDAPPPLADPLAATRLRILWSLIQATGPGTGALVDCGSGHGELVGELERRNFAVVGIEISETAVEYARLAHPASRFICHSVEERPWPIPQSSFDYATCFEVVEHLLQPIELLRGAYEALRPGGYLALTTPYHGRIKNVAIALLGFERHFDVRGDHIRFFTDGSLRDIVNDTGFAIEKTIHFGRLPGLWSGVFIWARKP